MKKRSVGRPPRAQTAATERLELRLTASELKRWNKAADRANQSLSEWVRESCERRVDA